MDIATKTGIGTTKTASKRVAQKTAEAAGDLIGKEIADKITSVGKTKSKEKEEEETNKRQKIYIPPEKRQQIKNNFRLFQRYIKMEYQKIISMLDTTFDNVPDLLLKCG